MRSIAHWRVLIIAPYTNISICWRRYCWREDQRQNSKGKLHCRWLDSSHLTQIYQYVGRYCWREDQRQNSKGNCIADGWTQTDVHYVAIYHHWPILEKDRSIKNLTSLLAIQPLLDESDLSSVSFSEFIAATYSLYMSHKKISDTMSHDSYKSQMDELDLIVALTLDNCSTNKATVQKISDTMSHDSYKSQMDELDLIAALTLDNCSTNKATVQQLNKPMIGAQCHRLNLAAAHWTKDAFDGKLQSTLDNIHAVMIWASTIKNCARL